MRALIFAGALLATPALAQQTTLAIPRTGLLAEIAEAPAYVERARRCGLRNREWARDAYDASRGALVLALQEQRVPEARLLTATAFFYGAMAMAHRMAEVEPAPSPEQCQRLSTSEILEAIDAAHDRYVEGRARARGR